MPMPSILQDPDETGSIAGKFLRKAAEIVEGKRNTTHGDKERSFVCIARFWSDYLDIDVSPVDVAQMMVLMKIARAKCGDHTELDHYVDAAGYSAIAGELSCSSKTK